MRRYLFFGRQTDERSASRDVRANNMRRYSTATQGRANGRARRPSDVLMGGPGPNSAPSGQLRPTGALLALHMMG